MRITTLRHGYYNKNAATATQCGGTGTETDEQYCARNRQRRLSNTDRVQQNDTHPIGLPLARRPDSPTVQNTSASAHIRSDNSKPNLDSPDEFDLSRLILLDRFALCGWGLGHRVSLPVRGVSGCPVRSPPYRWDGLRWSSGHGKQAWWWIQAQKVVRFRARKMARVASRSSTDGAGVAWSS